MEGHNLFAFGFIMGVLWASQLFLCILFLHEIGVIKW